jgi:O-antigen ligase
MRGDVIDQAVGTAREGGQVTGVILFLLLIAALVDLPAFLNFGPLSGMGVLTLVEVGLTAVAVVACRSYPRRIVYRVAPYGVFLAWVMLTAMRTPLTIAGMQNGIVYVLFGLVILLTGTIAARSPNVVERAIERGVRWIDRIALTIAALSLILNGLPTDERTWVIGARSFALLGLLPLSWHVARWDTGRTRSGVAACLWLLAIGLSLSRTATAVGLLYVGIALLLQIRGNARFLLIRAPAVVFATAVIVAVLARGTPIAERLFTGDTSIEVGGVAVNASGRMSIWPVVTESAWKAPVVGQGLGSSMLAAGTVDGVGHPHNDYLRIWHDLGFVGLAAFAAAFAVMLIVLLRSVLRSRRRRDAVAAMQVAAFLGIIGLLIAATTDNAIIYPFVMAPLGVLVGAGLGAGGDRIRSDVSFEEQLTWAR